ncbi:MAG TPA: DNA gyrase inhibitor YacG [Gammaproteobacteria bacterium]|nr:DNA gyrase inhibitor YacG [Gammaproteobacteria bacterium]
MVSCPTCQRSVKWTQSNEQRPFCSDRCRLIDLGEWAGEGHRIPGEAVDDPSLGVSSEDDDQP